MTRTTSFARMLLFLSLHFGLCCSVILLPCLPYSIDNILTMQPSLFHEICSLFSSCCSINVVGLLFKKCAGLNGSRSFGSLLTYVKGRLFSIASHSVSTVIDSSSVISLSLVGAVIALFASLIRTPKHLPFVELQMGERST